MGKAGRPRKKPTSAPPLWAARLTQMREARGLTQKQLADALGGSQSSVTDYETGRSEPRAAMWRKIADVLDVAPEWLLFGKPGDSDPFEFMSINSEEQKRLFAWTLHRGAKMLAEEGLDGDLIYLHAYTRKLISAAQGSANEAEAKEAIARAIEAERAEFRRGINEIRKNRI